MPLPVLNRLTFEPTGQTLTIDDYFNPIHNHEYPETMMSRARSGTMLISDILLIAKQLLTTESLDELLPCIAQNLSGNRNHETKTILREIYGMLPDDSKHLLFFTRVVYHESPETGLYIYRIYLRYPEQISYSEVYCESVINTLSLRVNLDGRFVVPQSSADAFQAWLPTAIETVYRRFTALASDNVNVSDSFVPSFINFLYRYASGQNCFYPQGDANNFPVSFDMTSPARLARYMSEGCRITISLSAGATKLTFTARPAPGDRRVVERVLNYSANVMDYLPYTIQGPKEPKAVLYGVELEANSDYEPKQLIDAQKDLFFIMKQDSSVYGAKRYNYELVTVPASLKAHKRLWAEFFEKIDYHKFDTSKDTGNGMHVHIDRKAFSKSHLNRLTWFITNPANEDFILAISERPTKRNLDEWARMPNHSHLPSKISAARNATGTNGGIRGAVHYKANKTVEIRLFKGIVSYATVVKNLEFVDSVFHFTQVTSLSQLTLRNYVAWLNATPANKYQMLKAFLAEIKLDDMLSGSDIVEHIWTLRTEHLVAEKLNKAPFKVTNAHVTYLNKKRRKRVFILKNGQIQCVASSGGLLAKLDKSVQQKQTRGAASFSMSDFAA